MTTADRWARTVREQLGLGRFLPLGTPADGAWIAERAAREVLLTAVAGLPGVRLDRLRLALADPEAAPEPAVPAPPSALPPGPLRMTADLAATAADPLPVTADRVRATLAQAASLRLGLTVGEVDLRVTALLDTDPEPERRAAPPERQPEAGAGQDSDEERAGRAVLAVAGVTRLTGALGRSVHVSAPEQGAVLPRRHVRVECAVGAEHRTVEVARRVRAAVADALADRPSVAVLVTAVD
ncbi:nucleopolyhedrovirus P10 family protein [Streptomyces sp. ISL-12]|uniref:nucleopolyhedrovirus P10 family protein n=1 Tax=Streptomyces sp. ISL-12 TaxID=2819177 RepID=UPI001BE8EC29|nr:nucleopolyhedrovirus P10 family protein [Streptomyces sp. ISL-12]MBT2411310.1 nucleopolyhedrovirus P10 family protein [Streptomyces sp. ISL-12]